MSRDSGVVFGKLPVVAETGGVLQKMAKRVGRAGNRRVEREALLIDELQCSSCENRLAETPPRDQRSGFGPLIRAGRDGAYDFPNPVMSASTLWVKRSPYTPSRDVSFPDATS
jgi:hypothetical protein